LTGKILTFYLCGSLCGIDIRVAQEINRNITYTSVPGANSYVVGLLNLRSQVVTVLDLGKLLHFKQVGESNKRHCIILKSRLEEPDQVGFFIDKLGDVIDVTPEMCEHTPANMIDIENHFIHEVVKLRNEIVLVLDLSNI